MPRVARDGVGERVVVRRDDDKSDAVEVVIPERSPVPRDPGFAGQLVQPRGEGRRDQDEPRARSQQEPGLGLRCL